MNQCIIVASIRRSAGVIIEGFPSTTDEAEFMATKGIIYHSLYLSQPSSYYAYLWCFTGLFPDATIILKVDNEDVVKRILPNKMVIWRRKRDKRLAIRDVKKQKRIKEWVSDGYC